MAVKGGCTWHTGVKVTKDKRATHRVNLFTEWIETEDEPWLLMTNLDRPEAVEGFHNQRFRIEEMFSDHKSRGLNLEATRITDPDRLQRLLVALSLAYLWILEVGSWSIRAGTWRQVDNRGRRPSVSLCQLGLRWLDEWLLNSSLPRPLRFQFDLTGKT